MQIFTIHPNTVYFEPIFKLTMYPKGFVPLSRVEFKSFILEFYPNCIARLYNTHIHEFYYLSINM